MWRGALAVVLVGCYSPADNVTPCAVSCARSAPCPGDLECGSDLLCHAPGAAACSTIDATIDDGDAEVAVTTSADLIAWSQADIRVAASTGTRFAAPALWYSMANTVGDRANLVCDVDGNGRADLVAWSSNSQFVALSTGTSFAQPAQWRSGAFDGDTYLCGDANGDGLGDLILVTGGDVSVATANTGNAFTAPTVWSSTGSDPFSGSHGTFTAHLDTDAKIDLIGWGDNNVWVKISVPGDAYSTGVSWYGGSSFSTFENRVGDVDGDGLTDLIAWNTTSVFVQLLKNQVFMTPAQWSSVAFSGSIANLVADVNADGRDDLIAWSDTSVQVALSTGTSFAAPTTWLSPMNDFRGNVKNNAANVDF
jgi:hypothetical protein